MIRNPISEEYFDWVDRFDRAIGITSRLDAHRQNLFHRAVHLYAVGENGGVILQRRSLEKDLEPGLWTVSCSGHVDRGESYLQAGVRELEEELGVSVEPENLRELLRSDPSFENGYEFVRSYEVMGVVYPKPNPLEVSEVREIQLKELHLWLRKEPARFSSSMRCLFPLASKRFTQIT